LRRHSGYGKNFTKIILKLYFFKEKRLVLLFLILICFVDSYAQEGKPVADSLIIKTDTVQADTLFPLLRKPSKGGIESKLTYKAATKVKRDIINKQFILVKNAVIDYGDMEIKADSIVINMKTDLLFAIGIKDSTGKVNGKPAFKQGTNEFESDELTYNFKTRKALVKNIVTKQDQGLLHSQFTKLLEDGTSNISRSTYSTCDADTPHFYINLPKARVYPGKKIVSGPGNLVLEGIPLPLVIPFGFFPIQTKRAASGIIIPRYGEERTRGFSLSDGGYYFAVSDYFDLQLKGSVYSNGSWLGTAQTDYKRLYKYSGNFAFSYANNISGHKGLSDYNKSTNYRLSWIFQQDAKASPGSRFAASVNMSSSAFDQNNSYNVSDHITTQRQSSISYSKSWEGTPFNLSISANHSQNVKNKTVDLDLPKANFNINRIYPFKSKISTGKSKWYEEIQVSYTAQMDNKISTKDSLLFTSQVWKHMTNGFKQEIPVSLQIRPFNNFSISPSLTYTGVLYTQKVVKSFDLQNVDPVYNKLSPIVNDTLHGLFYGQAVNPTISANFSPQIFGTYDFSIKSPNSRLQTIRHVIKPSVSFSYTPSFSGLSSKMYRQVQVPVPYKGQTLYSIYDGNIFGTPATASKSGNITFNITNIVEAKMFAKNDTTGKPKKVKLIDNFGISTAYNIFADSMKWQPLTLDFRTQLLNNINITASSSFSIYGYNSTGIAIGTLYYNQLDAHGFPIHKLMRMTNMRASLDFSLSDLLKLNKDKNKQSSGPGGVSGGVGSNTQSMQNSLPGSGAVGQKQGAIQTDEYGYAQFNVPWTLNVSYSMSYINNGIKPLLTHAVSLNNGSVTLTKKMGVTFTTGYDFTGKKITMTQIGVTRDLHCWEMSINWVPNGTMQSWNFLIRVKAPVLGDLKYERRKDYHDTY